MVHLKFIGPLIRIIIPFSYSPSFVAHVDAHAQKGETNNHASGPLSLPVGSKQRSELREMQQQTRSEDGYFSGRTLGGSTSNNNDSSATASTAAVRSTSGGPTVITVRSGSSDPHFRVNGAGVEYLNSGGGGGAAERPHSTSPNDRTSLLQSENPVS